MHQRPTVEQLPVFVYGTLLPGHPNFIRLFGKNKWQDAVAVTVRRGHVHDHVMLAEPRSAFPYLAHCDDVPSAYRPMEDSCVVHGALLEFLPEDWDEVIERLDHLEGVPDHYVRAKVTVVADKVCGAWVYRLARENVPPFFTSPICEFNRWQDHIAKYRTYPTKE